MMERSLTSAKRASSERLAGMFSSNLPKSCIFVDIKIRPPYALRSCVKQAGYSFREVSRETTIPESTLYSWASGKQVIPHASRERLAQVIGCAVEELAPKRLGVPV